MRPALVLIATALLSGCAAQSKNTSLPIGIGRGINDLQGTPCQGKGKCIPVVLPASKGNS
jgi:hypothetical protein